MKPKYYIDEFYIKNSLLSFVGLMVLATILSLILDHISIDYFAMGLAVFVALLGVIAIGYFNAFCALKEQGVKVVYLHSILILFVFMTDIIWGEINFFISLFRGLAYFICLEFGVYLFKNKRARAGKII